jgi:hypothetical protein
MTGDALKPYEAFFKLIGWVVLSAGSLGAALVSWQALRAELFLAGLAAMALGILSWRIHKSILKAGGGSEAPAFRRLVLYAIAAGGVMLAACGAVHLYIVWQFDPVDYYEGSDAPPPIRSDEYPGFGSPEHLVSDDGRDFYTVPQRFVLFDVQKRDSVSGVQVQEMQLVVTKSPVPSGKSAKVNGVGNQQGANCYKFYIPKDCQAGAVVSGTLLSSDPNPGLSTSMQTAIGSQASVWLDSNRPERFALLIRVEEDGIYTLQRQAVVRFPDIGFTRKRTVKIGDEETFLIRAWREPDPRLHPTPMPKMPAPAPQAVPPRPEPLPKVQGPVATPTTPTATR